MTCKHLFDITPLNPSFVDMDTENRFRYTIRPLESHQDYVACEELQAEAWQMPDYRDSVPAALLKVSQENGGVLLGAFDSRDQLVGFVYGILGMEDRADGRHLKHHSHMLAVKPEWRRSGLGIALKFAQREKLIAQGIELATWTFDPLQAVNARLNLIRLGAIARHYLVNAYGEMTDALNFGLPSDRFEVEWWVNSPRAQACAEGQRQEYEWNDEYCVLELAQDSRGLQKIRKVREMSAEAVLVEIPDDINEYKRADLELCKDWRMKTRDVFVQAFVDGLVAIGIAEKREEQRTRIAYVLTRDDIFAA